MLALALTLGMAAGFTTGAAAEDNTSSLPDGQAQTFERNNEENGPQDTYNVPGGVVSVNREDEHKFTPEDWAKILESVEQGKVRWVEDESDMTPADSAAASFVSKDSSPFTLVNETGYEAGSSDVPN